MPGEVSLIDGILNLAYSAVHISEILSRVDSIVKGKFPEDWIGKNVDAYRILTAVTEGKKGTMTNEEVASAVVGVVQRQWDLEKDKRELHTLKRTVRKRFYARGTKGD